MAILTEPIGIIPRPVSLIGAIAVFEAQLQLSQNSTSSGYQPNSRLAIEEQIPIPGMKLSSDLHSPLLKFEMCITRSLIGQCVPNCPFTHPLALQNRFGNSV